MSDDDLFAPLAVDADPVYPIGYPAHVGVTLALAADEAAARVPPTDPLLGQGPVELGLVAPDGRVVLPLPPFARRVPHDPPRLETLVSGRPRRALVDLSPWLDELDLAPGVYAATIRYHCLADEAVSAPFALALRAPHAGDRTFLAELDPPRAPGRSWSEWTLAPPSPRPPPLDALFRDDPVRYNRALRHLLIEAIRLDGFDLALLDRLVGVYALDAGLLQVELLRLRGEVAAAAALADRLRADHPAAAEALDAVDRDEGTIATLRGIRAG
ncbi:MAG: hypothetical protein JWM10_3764 [Myxococcaceae bacterium]|nr:hypothetical protein [Myxococcaceae bacterium]